MSSILVFLNLSVQALEQNIDNLTLYGPEAEYRGPARHKYVLKYIPLSFSAIFRVTYI
jgi:hypothetical protein